MEVISIKPHILLTNSRVYCVPTLVLPCPSFEERGQGFWGEDCCAVGLVVQGLTRDALNLWNVLQLQIKQAGAKNRRGKGGGMRYGDVNRGR